MIMSSMKAFSRYFLLCLLAGLLVPAIGSGADDHPDFSGVWVFNETRSDDLRAKVEESVGPEATSGDIKQDFVRIWIRQWLLGVLDDPESRYLTVEQSSDNFKTGLGDEISTYYFGRVASSRGPAGGTLRVRVNWQGGQLVTEEASKDGGRITAVYTMLPPGNTVLIRYRLEHKSLRQPLEVSMFFDREEESR
jgi:hypothetical protein